MTPELHKLLLELDNEDFVTTNYFKWSEVEKKRLTSDIVRYFMPLIRTHKENVLFGLYRSIIESEEREDYEQADILNRCFRSLEKMR